MERYLTGIVMVISGILLLVMTKDKYFPEVEQSFVIAYSFLLFGFLSIVYKFFRKR